MRRQLATVAVAVIGVVAFASGDHAVGGSTPTRAIAAGRTPASNQFPPGPVFNGFQGNASHDGVVNETLRHPLRRQWQVALAGTPSYAVIGDDRVIVTVYDAPTGGTLLYGFTLTGHLSWGPLDVGTGLLGPAYDRGRVFISTADGLVLAYNASSGRLDWVTQLPDEWVTQAQPVASDGQLLVTGDGDGGSVYRIDETNGQFRSERSADFGDNAPAATSTDLYLTDDGSPLDVIRSSQQLRWGPEDFYDSDQATPQVGGDALWVKNGDQAVRINLATGEQTLSIPATQAVATRTQHGHTRVYVVRANTVNARDLGARRIDWHRTLDSPIVYPPLIVGTVVIVTTADGTVDALNALTGRLAGRRHIAPITWVHAPQSSAGWADAGSPQGLAAGEGLLIVPGSHRLIAFN